MKIAIFTDSFLPGVGGTEKAVLGLAKALSEKHEVVVCCPYYGKKTKDSFPFKVIRANSIKLTQNDYFAFPGLTKNFKKALDEFNPDIIHCQSISPMTTFAVKYAQKNRIPVIMTVHTKFKMAFSRSIKSKFIVDRLISDMVKKLNRVDKVFSVSNDMIGELRSYGFDGGVSIIRNGASFDRISPKELNSIKALALEKYGLQNEENILLYVGHIVKFKNLEFIFNVLYNLKKQGVKFKMLFVGKGCDDFYFRKLCSNLNLNDCVIFTGEINDKKLLSSLYSISDLYLFPSLFDNDPLTVVEAALHRVPSLTLKNSGSSERIDDNKSGYIIDNNVDSYTKKIQELLDDKKQLDIVGNNAEKMIPKDWDTTASEYLEIYQTLIEEKNKVNKKDMVI